MTAVGVRPDQRGSATLLTVAAIAIVFVVAGAVAVLIGYQGTARRAAQAADLAAVSAARTVAFGEPGCPIAQRIARDNGAHLIDCEHVGDSLEFAVTVEVRVDTRSRLPGLPASMRGRASAGRLTVS